MERVDTHLSLGTGGGSPRVVAYCPDSRTITSMVEVPGGHSVYRGEWLKDGHSVAIGLKTGSIVRCARNDTAGGGENRFTICDSWQADSPLLGLAAVDPDGIAFSTISGRLGFLAPTEQGAIRTIRACGTPICAMTGLADGSLATLDVDGRIEVWSVSEPACARYVNGPRPPPLWSLVKLQQWVEHGLLVYPGHGGLVVLVGIETGVVQSIQAHEGECYAICVAEDRLVTIGHADGRCRAWTPKLAGAGPTRPCDTGIVAVGALDRRASRIVAVSQAGTALCFGGLVEAGLVRDRLPGEDYRTVWSPNFDATDELARRRNGMAVHKAAYELADRIDAGETQGHESALQQIATAGYRPLFHALCARIAESARSLPAALTHYRAFRATLPAPVPAAAVRTLARFADLLGVIRQWTAAVKVYEAILESDPAHPCRANVECIREIARHAEERSLVRESDLAMADLVRCVTAVGEVFAGKWIVRRFDDLSCAGLLFSQDAIHAICERLRRSGNAFDGWSLGVADVAFAADAAVTVNPAIVIRSNEPSSVAYEYIARFVFYDRRVLVSSCVALAVCLPAGEVSADDHNRGVSREIERLQSDGEVLARMAVIHDGCATALREHLTARIARWTERKEWQS